MFPYDKTKKSPLFAAPLGVILTLTLFCCHSYAAGAQGGATVSGVITDERGSSVVGADIGLSARNGVRLSSRTDDNGRYSFNGIGPGAYLLEVRAEGFATFSSSINIERGQQATTNIRLSIRTINEDVVVVANGTPQGTDEVAKAVTILDDRQIENRRKLTLSEALRGSPGLRIQQQGSIGALTTIRLRGLRNVDTAILLDGLRVRDASDIGGSATSIISDLLPVDLDRVEILRGSGSSIYGTNAIGGAINLAPKTGSGEPRFEAGFEGGSLELFRERFKGSGGLRQRGGYSFGATRLDVRSGVDGTSQYGNTAAGGRLQLNLTPSIVVGANFYATTSNARIHDSPFALPGAFASSDLYPVAVAGLTFQPDFNNPDQGRRNNLFVGSLRLTQGLGDNMSYSVAYQRVSTHRRNYNGPGVDPRFASFYPFGDFEFSNTNNGVTNTIDVRLNLGLGRFNLITGGFEFESESIFQQSVPSFSAFNNTTDRQHTFALFGQDQIVFLNGRFRISVGLREQFYRVRSEDRPGVLAGINPSQSITGDGAIAYFIKSTGTKLRAHAGNGFRAPSLFERFGVGTLPNSGPVRFGDPTLRGEQSVGVDGGFDQLLARDRLRLSATYFYTRLQRVIVFQSFASDPLGLGRFNGYANGSGGLSRGVETSIEGSPFRGTDIRASYTFTNSKRFVPDGGLQREYVIPKHMIGFNINQRLRAFLLSLDLHRTGEYVAPVFENNFPFRSANLRFSGYTKADFFASYERALSERVTAVIFAGAENIFDESYYENGFYAPGLAGRAGINFRF